jgi:outer membrane protein TolC
MELQKQLTIETQMTELLTRYYQAAEATEQSRLQEELVGFSRERLERAETNMEYGRGSSLDVTNAQVDLRRDEANLINARMILDQRLRELLIFMGRTEAEVELQVETRVEYGLVLSRSDLIDEAMKRNLQLSLVDADRALLSYDEQILEAQRKPIVSFNTAYSYSFQDFGQGAFFAQQRSNGVGAGINVAWELYDGGRTKQQRQALEVQMQGNRLRKDQQQLQIRNQLLNLYDNYQAALELNEVEKQSIQASRAAFERTREEYNLGRLGQIEFRQAQVNLRNAQLAERQSAYNAKIIELQIMQLAGLIRDARYNY